MTEIQLYPYTLHTIILNASFIEARHPYLFYIRVGHPTGKANEETQIGFVFSYLELV